MTTLNRLVIAWSGPQITGAAVTVLHYSGSDNAAPPVGAVKAAFQAAAGGFPQGVTWTFPNSGDRVDDTTGALTGVWSSTGGGVVNASGPAQCAAGVGACVTWSTGGIVNGSKGPRKLRGRTFFVPLQIGMYDADGTLAAGALPTLDTLASGITNAGPLAIWHRPSGPGASNGNSYGVISHRVRDKVAVLRSRRD